MQRCSCLPWSVPPKDLAPGTEAEVWLPIAVDPACRDQGLGLALLNRACEVAAQGAILLVGDEPFFARAGFSAAAAKGVIMPGPVDQSRVLLWGADGLSGLAQPLLSAGRGQPAPSVDGL